MSIRSNNVDGFDVNDFPPVRTLCVRPIQPDMDDDIKKYFEQFGVVNSVEIQPQDNNSHALCCLVEFKTTEMAVTVLSNEIHCIGDSEIQVKAAEPWHQPDQILNALNNDCLRNIFSYFDSRDLTRSANVCVQFNQLAKSVFSSSDKELDLTQCNYDEVKKSLKLFGSMAQSIDINRYSSYNSSRDRNVNLNRNATNDVELMRALDEMLLDFSTDSFDSIYDTNDRFCTPMLKELTLTGFRFKCERFGSEWLEHEDPFIHRLFQSSLERLHLNRCHLSKSSGNLLAPCNELKLLDLQKCTLAADTYVQKFEKLEQLRLIEVKGFNDDHLRRFIALNPTVTKLSLSRIEYGVHPTKIIITILENLRNLQELELDMRVQYGELGIFAKCIPFLCKLTSLKVLKLNLNSLSATLLSACLTKKGTPIEQMRLRQGKIDTECVKYISQMAKLKILELIEIHGLTDDHVIELAKCLGHQLEKLGLDGSTAANFTTVGLKEMLSFAVKLNLLSLDSTEITIDAESYEVILSILRNRPEKVKFLLKLTGDGGQVEVSKKILGENDDIFNIDHN